MELLTGGGLSRQACAAGLQGHKDQSPSFFSSHIQEEIRVPQHCWVSLLSTLDIRAASQTPLSDLCHDGNKTSFLSRDLIVAWITKCFETALKMDRIKSFPLLKSIEIIMKKVADSSELSHGINMYSCFSLASGSFTKRCV